MTSHESVQGLDGMAEAMAVHTPISSQLLSVLIQDLSSSGPISKLVGNHSDASTPLFALRVLAGVKLLMLNGQAPELTYLLERLASEHTDTQNLELIQHTFRTTVLEHWDEIRKAIHRPVQQHLPNRASFLLRGLGMLGSEKVRLLELGACAGLTLIPDRYHWFGRNWQWGDRKSAVRMPAEGPWPGEVSIVERAGCDLSPRNPKNETDRMILRSFIPPERHEDQSELDAALILASESPVRVDEGEAAEWLREQLQRKTDPDTYTVVWHTHFWGYLNTEKRSQIEEILEHWARQIKLARISYEPKSWGAWPLLQVTVYS